MLESFDKRRAAAALQTSWTRRSHMDDVVRDLPVTQPARNQQKKRAAIEKIECNFCRVHSRTFQKIRVHSRTLTSAALNFLTSYLYGAQICVQPARGFLARTFSYFGMPQKRRGHLRTFGTFAGAFDTNAWQNTPHYVANDCWPRDRVPF